MEYTVITGASSGIGKALAELCAQKGHNLILIARRKDRLVELADTLKLNHQVQVECIVADLGQKYADVCEHLKDKHITCLINNAGFGEHTAFVDAQRNVEMINLNVLALTQVTQAVLPQMIVRKKGYIMQVASIAGFIPGPYMAVYFATKSYVISLSEALAEELKDTGVSVTCLCPGPTQSEFAHVAGVEGGIFSGNIPTSQQVAHFGYEAMMAKKTIAIYGVKNRFSVFSTRFAPRKTLRAMVAKMNKMS